MTNLTAKECREWAKVHRDLAEKDEYFNSVKRSGYRDVQNAYLVIEGRLLECRIFELESQIEAKETETSLKDMQDTDNWKAAKHPDKVQ